MTPDTIEFTINEMDVIQAKDWYDTENCLEATCLKRRGYRNVSIAGFGIATIDQVVYRPSNDSSFIIDSHCVDWNSKPTREGFRPYKPEVIGKTVTLQRCK